MTTLPADPNDAAASGVAHPTLADKPRTVWRDAFDRIKTSRTATIATICVAVYFLVGLLGFTPALNRAREDVVGGNNKPPALFRVDDNGAKRLAPSLWFGTDFIGRSVLWRFLYGVRVALTVAVLASIVETVIGLTLGALAGYLGGWVDALVIWLFSTVASIPWLLLMIALAYGLKGREFYAPWTESNYLPLAGIPTIILALGLSSWVGLCRLIRAEVLKHRDRDYVTAARAAGVGHGRIMFRHILPNVFHIVIINFSLGLAGYVQAEVVLSFLGLGVTDQPSWGRMIDDAKLELLKGVWWQMAAATVGIFVLSLVVNLFGDALRDALDPRLRGTD
ncbi:MAG: peptide/nickel transport system permease protein [Humisphaera sp.]|nr:peptide/nickel transport system permease protein [Humisphaera sp.]